MTAPPARIALADGEVDLTQRVVRRVDRVAHLTEQECALLAWLAARPGEDIARDTLLTEVLGYAATARSRAVDLTVRRLRTKLEADPSEPRHLLTVYGVGYRLQPAAESDRPLRTNVPPPRTALIGRDAELRQVLDALRDDAGDPVTLVGPPGVGKTRLAHAVAREAARTSFPAGAFAVDLSAAADVEAELANAAGLSPGQDVDGIARALAARGPTLILLDDAESDLAAARSVAEALTGAGVHVVTTSRVPTGAEGERVVPLPPLSPDDAVSLFSARASEARVGWEPGDQDDEAIARIVQGTDALPLALELAATRVRSMSASTIAAGLDRSLMLLRDRGSGRHASMAAALQWSWDELSSAARSHLVQLSVFRDGASREAVAGVLDSHGVQDSLDVLAARGLIRVDAHGRVLPFHVVRQFAASRADEASLAEATERHRAWFARWASEQAGQSRGRGSVAVLAALRREQGNLAAALDASLPDHGEDAAWLVHALSWSSAITGGGAISARFGEVLDAIPDPCPARCLVLHDQLWSHFVGGGLDDALRVSDVLGTESDAIGDLQGRVDARRARAAVHATAGRQDEALASGREAVAIAADDDANALRAHQTLGGVLLTAGRPAEARAEFETAIDLAKRQSDEIIERLARTNLATAWAIGGNDARARALWDELVPTYRKEDRESLANVLYNRGCNHLYNGRADSALDDLERALDIYREVGRLDRLGWYLTVTGVCAAVLELHADALELVQQGIREIEAAGLGGRALAARSLHGAVAALAGRSERARTELEAGRDVLEQVLGPDVTVRLIEAWTGDADRGGALSSIEGRQRDFEEIRALHAVLLRCSLDADDEGLD